MADATDVPVALLYPTEASGAHIRDVLLACGTPIVYETRAQDADRQALEASGAQVVVVNLDAEMEGLLDDLQVLLAGNGRRVIFNDGQVSSGLTGWDQARWVRHLVAKIRGDNEMNPPRPLDAEAIPVRDVLSDAVDSALHDVLLHDLEPLAYAVQPSAVEASELEIAEPDAGTPIVSTADPAESDMAGSDAAGADLTPVGWEAVTDSGLDTTDILAEEEDSLRSEEHEDTSERDFMDSADALTAFAMPTAKIEARATERSDTPDFSDWTPEDLHDDQPPPVITEADEYQPADFGVEIVDPNEFLAPETESVSQESILRELSLEPMEDNELASLSEPRPDHEVWFEAEASRASKTIARVWIVAAATGGPQAVRVALAKLPSDYPAVFMLVQQMGAEFVDVMLDQLAGSSALRILHPRHGQRMLPGDVIVVPDQQTFNLDHDGVASLVDEEDMMPIDRLLCEIADTFGEKAGAIVLSGVSPDSLDGLRYLRDKGGTIWIQDPESCLVGGLAEAARDAALVQFTGTPDQLADRLLAEGIASFSDQ